MKDFSGFLSDSEVYESVVSYWSELCKEILSDSGRLSRWRGWLNVEFSDGTPFMDGNPIYSLVNKSDRLALKVIQVSSEKEGAIFESWEDGIEIEGVHHKVLVIYCSLVSEVELQIKTALESWFGMTGENGA